MYKHLGVLSPEADVDRNNSVSQFVELNICGERLEIARQRFDCINECFQWTFFLFLLGSKRYRNQADVGSHIQQRTAFPQLFQEKDCLFFVLSHQISHSLVCAIEIQLKGQALAKQRCLNRKRFGLSAAKELIVVVPKCHFAADSREHANELAEEQEARLK